MCVLTVSVGLHLAARGKGREGGGGAGRRSKALYIIPS